MSKLEEHLEDLVVAIAAQLIADWLRKKSRPQATKPKDETEKDGEH